MRFDEDTTLLQWGMAIALALGAAALISSVFGYPIGGATVGMAMVIVATLSLLRALARLVARLTSQDAGLEFVSDDGRSARSWREEKKRALGAIQELKLDYEMRKISDKDYQQILAQYEARALEAIHALDAKMALHPDLVHDLARDPGEGASVGAKDAASSASATSSAGAAGAAAATSSAGAAGVAAATSSAGAAGVAAATSFAGATSSPDATNPASATNLAGVTSSPDAASPASATNLAGAAGVAAATSSAGAATGPAGATQTCSRCGETGNDADARFCKSCGESL